MSQQNNAAQSVLKRCFDFIFGVFALILFLIPMIIVAVIIKTSSKGPALFKQQRPGKNNKIFLLYKFRSMSDLRDESGKLLSDDNRLTKIGKFIRRYSLDELPEIWNVIKGDMSFVGPRPLLVAYLDRYTAEQARRHEVKPGITGWVQIKGRNAATWEEKFKYDIWYINNWNIWLDIKIIFVTIVKVISGEGISQPGQATMEEFKGSGDNHDR